MQGHQTVGFSSIWFPHWRSRHQLAGDKSRAEDPYCEPASRAPSSTSDSSIWELVTTPFFCAGCDRYACFSRSTWTTPGQESKDPDGLLHFPVSDPWVIGSCTGPFFPFSLFPARHAPCAMQHAPCTVSVCMTSRSSALDDRPWSYVPLSWIPPRRVPS
jgi:hypothetical protein